MLVLKLAHEYGLEINKELMGQQTSMAAAVPFRDNM